MTDSESQPRVSSSQSSRWAHIQRLENMKKWYQYPDGIFDGGPEAKIFTRNIRRYALKKFAIGATAILILAATVLAPVFILAMISQHLPLGWPRLVSVVAGLPIAACILRSLNRSRFLSRHLPSLPNCSFCGGVLDEVSDQDGDEFLVCQRCNAHGIVGVRSYGS